MPQNASWIRGKLFERFIKEILVNSGFVEVQPDGKIIYKCSSGLMLHGLGQPHNTDVLVNPPFQIPFFFPSRLIVECKCYDEPVGLPVIREALGLREDVNSFDIVTEDILKKRRNYKRTGTAVFDMDRYFYQVAVASLNGFKKTAEEFAIVHRIPLIDINGMPFSNTIRNFLFDNKNLDIENNTICDFKINEIIEQRWSSFKRENRNIFENSCVGILSSGDILFLYSNDDKWFFDVDEISLHWEIVNNEMIWKIKEYPDGDKQILFMLPKNLLEQWVNNGFDLEGAIHLKETKFKYIYIMGKRDNFSNVELKILRLSSQSIMKAREKLKT